MGGSFERCFWKARSSLDLSLDSYQSEIILESLAFHVFLHVLDQSIQETLRWNSGVSQLHQTAFDPSRANAQAIRLPPQETPWKLVSTLPVQYNVGHIAAAGGDTANPLGKYLVALKKWSVDHCCPRTFS